MDIFISAIDKIEIEALILHTCPYCWPKENYIKSGFNRNGTQRYRCRRCKRYSTAKTKRKNPKGEFGARAVRLYLDGMSLRAVARLLGVHHQTVGRWVASRTQDLRELAIQLYQESGSVDYATYYLSMYARVDHRVVRKWIRDALPQPLKEQALSLRLKKTPMVKVKKAIGVDDERTVRKWIRQAKLETNDKA